MSMEYVSLGRSGLKVSRLCLGTMTVGNPAWRAYVLPEDEKPADHPPRLLLGIKLLRHGRHVLARSERGGARAGAARFRVARRRGDRDEGVLPMGEGPNRRGLSRKHVCASVEGRWRGLARTTSTCTRFTAGIRQTPVEETLRALDDLVRSGKVRYVGASSMAAWRFARALGLAELRNWTRFVSMQNHYNLVYREEEREMLPLCARRAWRSSRGVPSRGPARRQPPPHERRSHDARAERRVRPGALLRPVGLRDRRPGLGGGDQPGKPARAGRARLAATTAGCHVADRRRHAARSTRSAGRCAGCRPDRAECAYLEEPYVPHPVLVTELRSG